MQVSTTTTGSQKVITESLECICSIFHHFGMSYMSPRLFRAAIKLNYLTTREQLEEISDPLLKCIMSMVLMYKKTNFSLDSMKSIWKRIPFDSQLVSLSIRTFLAQNHYPRALVFHASSGRELVLVLCWMFIKVDLTSKYLSFFSDDSMFFPDTSMAYSEQIATYMKEDYLEDDFIDDSVEGLTNNILSKVNQLYNIGDSLANKSQYMARITHQLNEIYPGVTPTEFHIIIDSHASSSTGKKLNPHRYSDFEKEVKFHTDIYKHVTTFVEWVNSAVANNVIVESQTREDSIDPQSDELTVNSREETIEKYQTLRRRLLDLAGQLEEQDINIPKTKVIPSNLVPFHELLMQHAQANLNTTNTTTLPSPLSDNQARKLITSNIRITKATTDTTTTGQQASSSTSKQAQPKKTIAPKNNLNEISERLTAELNELQQELDVIQADVKNILLV